MGKNLYIIGGCNGAGKTTASYTILPEILDCREFVNADEIAYGLSPFNPEGVAVEAGRLALMRVAELLERDETFSIETTLAARTLVKLVRRAQNQGYNVSLLFFWSVWPSGSGTEVTTCLRRSFGAGTSAGFTICSIFTPMRWITGLFSTTAKVLVASLPPVGVVERRKLLKQNYLTK